MTDQELYELRVKEQLGTLIKIKEETGAVPPESLSRYNELVEEEGFIESKNKWCELYPDFEMISNIMDDFQTNDMLVEFRKKAPPPSIETDVYRIYKKCISFKQKFTKRIQKNLKFSHDTPVMFYASAQYCIDKTKVYSFINQYQKWYGDLYPLWNEVYYETADFIRNTGYDRLGWEFYIQNPELLKRKADKIKTLHENVVSLLSAGRSLVSKLDKDITSEYEHNGFQMSLYERELEIAQMNNEGDFPDETYCYVYTLECDLFVFYVGIAAEPQERFKQHIRGAISDESHLFKSKFIQKYGDEVRLKIVYEGTRRECKNFERAFIIKHSPLGNMTQGGEG